MGIERIRYCVQCGNALIEKMHSGRIRPTCPRCSWVYFPDPKVAVAVLIQKGAQVLLVQRLYDPHKGFWTLPSGFVDAGEDPILAAERECLEETGLEVFDIKLLDVIFSQEHPRGASILILYQAKIKPGELHPGDDANQAAYFNVNALPQLAFASTQEIIKKFIQS